MSLLLKGTEEITLPLKGEVMPLSREITTVNIFENKQLDLLAHLLVLSVLSLGSRLCGSHLGLSLSSFMVLSPAPKTVLTHSRTSINTLSLGSMPGKWKCVGLLFPLLSRVAEGGHADAEVADICKVFHLLSGQG